MLLIHLRHLVPEVQKIPWWSFLLAYHYRLMNHLMVRRWIKIQGCWWYLQFYGCRRRSWHSRIRNRAWDIDSRRCEYVLVDHSRMTLRHGRDRRGCSRRIMGVFWLIGRLTILLGIRLEISCFLNQCINLKTISFWEVVKSLQESNAWLILA